MVFIYQSRTDDDVRAVHGVDDLLRRNVMCDQTIWIDNDVKLTQLAAGHSHGCDPGQTREPGANDICGDVSQTCFVPVGRGEAVTHNGKNCEREPFDVSNL